MPLSGASSATEQAGRRLAVMAESLFLANLLLAPGIAFAALLWLWLKYKNEGPALAREHLHQTTLVSLYGGILIVVVTTIFIMLGGLKWEWTWVLVILYFTCIHSVLVLLGMVGLARAMAGQTWRYPVIGPRNP